MTNFTPEAPSPGPNEPGPNQPGPPAPRQIPLSTFLLVVTLIVALGGGAIAWILLSDDGSSGAAAAPAATTTTEPKPDGESGAPDSGEPDSGNPLDDLGDSLDGLLDGGGSTACLSGAGAGLLGGTQLDLPDDDPRAEYEAVAHAVEDERELKFDSIPEPVFVTQDQMRERLAALVERDYPDDVARADEELLTALGAIEPGTDLQAENTALLGDQVAGYYDPSNPGELVVLGDDTEPFDAIELTIIAHELEHALADQTLGLPIDEDPHTDDPDQVEAGHAVAEGDAVLTQTYFQFKALDLTELFGMMTDPEIAASQESLDDAPPFLAEQLMFPYEDGLAFICNRQQAGGWDAVDEVYALPPTTTAQILFPERYEAGVGAVDAPDPLAPDGAEWEEVRHQTFGAADLMFLLDIAGVDDARGAVEGWAGGEVTQWRRADEAAVRISLVERDDSDGQLCDAVTQWVDTLDGATTTCDGADISVVL